MKVKAEISDSEVRDVLCKAKGVMDELDWTQYTFYRWRNHSIVAVCAVGAVRLAARPESGRWTAKAKALLRAATDRLDRLVSESGKGIGVMDFNDTFADSKEDVIRLFEEACSA